MQGVPLIHTRRRLLAAAAGGLTASAAAAADAPAGKAAPKKTVGVVLYPDFEVLDVFGPVEMWGYVPDFHVIFLAQRAGPILSHQKVSVVADFSFETTPQLDIMMVPGGLGSFPEMKNPVMLDFIRAQDRRTELTTSVCSGSWLLAQAGLLEGRRATSNKLFFSTATGLPAKVEWVKHARWVVDGKYITSSGVSAGTDMALAVAARFRGRDAASGLARSLEYEWIEDPNNDPFAVA
jgi:transcriptional regulator GlxA family with amidase domain